MNLITAAPQKAERYHCEHTKIRDEMTHASTFDLLYSEISRYLINIHKAQFYTCLCHAVESLLFQMLNYLNVITAFKSLKYIKELSNQPKEHLNFFKT